MSIGNKFLIFELYWHYNNCLFFGLNLNAHSYVIASAG